MGFETSRSPRAFRHASSLTSRNPFNALPPPPPVSGTVSAYAARHGYTARQLSPAAGTKVPIHFAKYSEMLALMDGGHEWLVWLAHRGRRGRWARNREPSSGRSSLVMFPHKALGRDSAVVFGFPERMAQL